MHSAKDVPARLNPLSVNFPGGLQGRGGSEGSAQAIPGCVSETEVSHVNR